MTGWRDTSLVRLSLLALLTFGLLFASTAAAQRRRTPQPPGVTVSLTPASGEASPFRYVLEVRTSRWSRAEVVGDRRLLHMKVRPTEGRRRRALTCRHPGAPRSVAQSRVQQLGVNGQSVYREWVDLRMYCWGRALSALEAGAEVEVRYGFRRRGRGRWVARSSVDENAVARELEGESFTFAAVPDEVSAVANPEADANADETDDAEEGQQASSQVRVSMSRGDANAGRGIVFRPRLRATGDAVRVYLRDDLFRFQIRGPLGEAECALERTPIAPIIDFYSRVTRRRGGGGTVSVALACPDAFPIAGIYEVTPVVDLVYDGANYSLDDVATGTVEGPTVPVRIRRGEHGYLEQVPDEPTVEVPSRAGS